MNIVEIQSLNKLCHPLLDNIIANRRTIFILYVDKNEDQTHIKTLKRILKVKNFSIKCDKLSSIKELRQSRLFKQLLLYDGSTVAMLLPSFYNKQGEDVQNILDELVIRKCGKQLELIPVVFDNTRTHGRLQELKSLKLSGRSSTWWEKLKPYIGRPVGEVHSWLVERMDSDQAFLTFRADFDRLKLLLGSLPNDALPEALKITKNFLDLTKFLLKHCCTNSPTHCGRWPTCPEISKEITRNFQTNLDVEGVEDCVTYGSYRVQDISLLRSKHKESLVMQKPFPYSKETHIYIIHNDDPGTLSKLNLMVTLLAIHGYKCVTAQDIPAGENMLAHAAKAIKNSTVTAVIDFCGLSKSELAAAEFACMQNITGCTKFISVYCNSAANTTETNGLGEVMNGLTFPLDITYHHTKWLPKLLSMLEQPCYRKSVMCHFKSEKSPFMLVEIKQIAKKMKRTLELLQTRSERYAISLLLQDKEFVNFVRQAEYHAKEDKFSNSHPPTRNRMLVPKREEICSDDSASPSSNGTEDRQSNSSSFGSAGLHSNIPNLDMLLDGEIFHFEPTSFSDDSIMGRSADSGLCRLDLEADGIYDSPGEDQSHHQYEELFQRNQRTVYTYFSDDSSAYYTESKSTSIANSGEINEQHRENIIFHGVGRGFRGRIGDSWSSLSDDDDITAITHRLLKPDQNLHLYSGAIQVTTASKERNENSFDEDYADDDDDDNITAITHRLLPPDQNVPLYSGAIQTTTALKDNKNKYCTCGFWILVFFTACLLLSLVFVLFVMSRIISTLF